jgi:hypothetical protein
MKNFGKLFRIISIVAVIVCTMLACDIFPDPSPNPGTNPNPNPGTNQTPVPGDYDIGNLTQMANNITAVTITPKSGKSAGARTIYYAGTGSTTYTKSQTLPTAAGTYSVTFDVAAATGWNAASDLLAGVLTIGTPTPVVSDYTIVGLFQSYDNAAKTVTIEPKEGKSSGARMISYEGTSGTTYSKSTTGPKEKGTYAVTFDVAAAAGWNAATGLTAGNLVINDKQTPKESDYDITNKKMTQTAGSVTAAADVAKKTGVSASPGEYNLNYEGVSPTTYAKSKTLPTSAGKYNVTLEVAETTEWNPASFFIDTLTINNSNSGNQTQALSVTILGTPSFGNRLTADVVKSFSGKVEYQWWRDDEASSWGEENKNDVWFYDVGKTIKVKVKCGDKEAESQTVKIPLLEYTAKISWFNDGRYDSNYLLAEICIGDDSWDAWGWYGFSCQWFRNDVAVSGEDNRSPRYYLDNPNAGAKFKVKITGLSKDGATSKEVQIPAVDIILAGTYWSNVYDDEYRHDVTTLEFYRPYNYRMYWYTYDKTTDDYDDGDSYGIYTVNGSNVVLYRNDMDDGLSGTYNGDQLVFPGNEVFTRY